MSRFNEATVLVTGGASGMGKLFARGSIARAARRVILWDVDEPELAATAAELRHAGGVVDAVTAYRNVPAITDGTALRADLESGRLDALTFTSPSTVRHFDALLDASARAAATRCTIAAIGPLTAAALCKVGLPPDITPEQATARELVEALAAHVAGETDSG